MRQVSCSVSSFCLFLCANALYGRCSNFFHAGITKFWRHKWVCCKMRELASPHKFWQNTMWSAFCGAERQTMRHNAYVLNWQALLVKFLNFIILWKRCVRSSAQYNAFTAGHLVLIREEDINCCIDITGFCKLSSWLSSCKSNTTVCIVPGATTSWRCRMQSTLCSALNMQNPPLEYPGALNCAR